jgi:hypothetical protein
MSMMTIVTTLKYCYMNYIKVGASGLIISHLRSSIILIQRENHPY